MHKPFFMILSLLFWTISLIGCNSEDNFEQEPLQEENERIVPQGVIDNLFSSSQQEFFRSVASQNYYDGIPNILNGFQTVASYGGSLNFPFSTAVLNSYSNGIMGMSTSNLNEFEDNLYNLCNDYIAEINENSAVEENGRQPLITSIYIAPLSCQYWRARYGE